MMIVCVNPHEFFNPIKLEEGGQVTTNSNIGIHDLLIYLCTTKNILFIYMRNLWLDGFEELCVLFFDIEFHIYAVSKHTLFVWLTFKAQTGKYLCNFIM